MTISVRINGNFHQSACPSKASSQRDSECEFRLLTLSYHCSDCVKTCLKCEALRLNANPPFVRGCNEARQLKSRTFSCACYELCEE